MTNFIKILGIIGLAAAAACGSSGSSGTSTGGPATTGGTTTGGGIPAAPMLGSHQIDRMGRGAVNTALTAPLNSFALDGGTIDEPAAKDYYNDVSNPTQWTPDFQAAFATSLAIYDGLDGDCGNQILAGNPDGGNLHAYGALAAVLTDDQLYVDTSVTTCNLYLGVELEALGAAKPGMDCGGRTPLENIIDETYSALAIGKTSGVTNGITSKADGGAQLATFPFLGAP